MHDVKCVQSVLCAKMHCLCRIKECRAGITQELGPWSAGESVEEVER